MQGPKGHFQGSFLEFSLTLPVTERREKLYLY
jgi:hypothetical protein